MTFGNTRNSLKAEHQRKKPERLLPGWVAGVLDGFG
jgi:hypothetical protein